MGMVCAAIATPLPSEWNFGLDFSAFAAPFQTVPGTDTMAIVQVFLQPALLLFVFSLLMSDFFDTMGTVVAVGEQGKFVDKDGNVEDIHTDRVDRPVCRRIDADGCGDRHATRSR